MSFSGGNCCGGGGWWPGWGCKPPPPASNCPPSPTPPWARPSQSPLTQVIVDNTVAQILLDPNITFLNQVGGGPNSIALPNGAFLKQYKEIYIPTQTIATTATWNVAGSFAGGFTKLVFNALGYSALLQWDGAGWQLIGGNAALTP